MRERGSANDAMLTREQAMAIVEKAVKMSKADAVDVQVNTYTQGNIRFADNQVSTAGATTICMSGGSGRVISPSTFNTMLVEPLLPLIFQSPATWALPTPTAT